ncbi:PEP-CTERM motif protein [Thalassoglobus neptunius]|uniref:PEP-CTERM motif protein n=1 Tax=Thalassoglobus neptunius TaxID=1938619 RepID=A0A5C5X577_9PLAN|nr:choice-of-anchor M domain-containing protein [Thalassoglobus neptunius]TWT57375.1 PEP-CTERM motif protein [Thalassoglobus neptunius]
MRVTIGKFFAGIMASLVMTTSASAGLVEYSAGHSDIGVEYEDHGSHGHLHLHYHFGGDAVLDGTASGTESEYALDEAYIRVADSLMVSGAPLNSVGLGAGTGDAWVLPQNNVAGVPFVGLATEEVPANFGDVKFSLEGVTGPGEFSVWQSTGLGGIDIFMSTFDATAPDAITLAALAHSHFNYGFSAAGLYYVDIRAESVNDPSLFDTGTLIFAVGDSAVPPVTNPVPEPGSLVLMGIGALGFGGSRLKRRKKPSNMIA